MAHGISLHRVHRPPRLALIDREGLQGLEVEVELGQDALVIPDDQGARRVTVITEEAKEARSSKPSIIGKAKR